MAAKRIALILAGAVSKGAFEAGVVQQLARANVTILRIVATSSGALNGIMLAAGVRANAVAARAERLVELWLDRAGWTQVFHVSGRHLVQRDGLSDARKLYALMRAEVGPNPRPIGEPIQLRLVVTALGGARGSIGGRPATTFERVVDFSNAAFDSADGLEPMFRAAAASAALPLLFAPIDLPELGPCSDGGAVNNTPIRWSLDGDIGKSIDAVVVVTTNVELLDDSSQPLRGATLISRLAEIVTDERLYRDIRASIAVNDQLGTLAALRSELGDAAIDRVVDALGWAGRRQVELVVIRPTKQLPGSVFSGFFDRALREQYIAEGRAAVDHAIAHWR